MDEQQMANASAAQSSSIELKYTTQAAPDEWVTVRCGLIEFGLLKRLHGIDMMAMGAATQPAEGDDDGKVDIDFSVIDPETFTVLLYEGLRRRRRLRTDEPLEGNEHVKTPRDLTLDEFYGWVEELEIGDDNPEA